MCDICALFVAVESLDTLGWNSVSCMLALLTLAFSSRNQLNFYHPCPDRSLAHSFHYTSFATTDQARLTPVERLSATVRLYRLQWRTLCKQQQ